MSAKLRAFSRSLPMTLLRAREAVMDRFRPLLREHRITEQQWRVLRALSSVEHASASELGRMTCVSAPSLSRILRSLERRRLVTRRADANDLRSTLVSIAESGARLIAKVGPTSEARYAEIGRALGKARLDQLYDLLDRLEACLVAPAGSGPAAGRSTRRARDGVLGPSRTAGSRATIDR